MAENEVAANALVAQLRTIGIDARVAGAGTGTSTLDPSRPGRCVFIVSGMSERSPG